MRFPREIWNNIKSFMWPMEHNVMSWPEYHPLVCNPESRICLNNVYLAQKSRMSNPDLSLMEMISCKNCCKIKQDYGVPYCNICIPRHLSITVTYKVSGGKRELIDMKKIPKYESTEIFNIKHITGFNISKKNRIKPHRFILYYYLPNID